MEVNWHDQPGEYRLPDKIIHVSAEDVAIIIEPAQISLRRDNAEVT